MKTNQLFKAVLFILSLSIMFFITSCSADDGPMGPKGEQGAEGSIGIPGKDGAIIISGSGAPASSLGKIGDMYLDKTSSKLYGPKKDSDWGAPLNLKGEQGNTGAPGSKILSGAEAPSSATGAIGDYYLNTTTGSLFGPKTSSGWETSINLKGTGNVVASTWLDYDWHPILSSEKYKVMHYVFPQPFLNAVGHANLKSFSDAGGIILVYAMIDYAYGSGALRLFDFNLISVKCNAHPQILEHSVNMHIIFESLNDLPIPEKVYSSDKKQNRFRYVFIPAGIQLTSTGASAVTRSISDIDWAKLPYEEVLELLQLED